VIDLPDYAEYKEFDGTTITVTYKKVYTVQVVGVDGQGGVKYGEGEYMMHGQEIHVLGTLETNQLTALTVTGYKAYVTLVDATITVTYNKVYTIKVTGGRGNGGVRYNGTTYANGATFDVLESSFDEKLLEAFSQFDSILKSSNMEARELLKGDVDLVVCDGFSGNVLIKSTEGACIEVLKLVKKTLLSSLRAKIGALFIKKDLTKTKQIMDYNNYGGAVILGAKKTVVKGHGTSTKVSVFHCIEQAYNLEKNNLRQAIESSMTSIEN
jgi:hypothetical protein